MSKTQKLNDIQRYFRTNVGPVFCQPSAHLLHRYKKMEGMIGIVEPLNPWQIKANVRLLKVDWSLDTQYDELLEHYPGLKDSSHPIEDINILKPGIDIPGIVEDRYGNIDWRPSKLGDVVCISDFNFESYKISHPSTSRQYEELKSMVGVVVEKCSNVQEKVMVTFTDSEKGEARVINVPVKILVRLPESFRPSGKKAATKVQSSKAKFTVGQVVRVSASVSDENFMGLLGIVEKVHNVEGNGFANQSWEYTVDFDLLPNRCLSICEGENGHIDIITITRLRERDLDEWDEKVSDKPYFGVYRTHAKRNEVWVPHKHNFGTVKTTSSPKKSVGEGMSISVEVDGNQQSMSCRDVDYKWDKDALFSVLCESFVCLGVEQDDRNPNIKSQQEVYLYVFDYAKDVGKYMQYRILLGTLIKKPATTKKFARALLANKLTHPWQVYRYLRPQSLGYFYELFKANEYIDKVGEFCHAD